MYQNYIFDFYGTLVDIHTNESKPYLYKKIAGLYASYGAIYTPAEWKKQYIKSSQCWQRLAISIVCPMNATQLN